MRNSCENCLESTSQFVCKRDNWRWHSHFQMVLVHILHSGYGGPPPSRSVPRPTWLKRPKRRFSSRERRLRSSLVGAYVRVGVHIAEEINALPLQHLLRCAVDPPCELRCGQ